MKISKSIKNTNLKKSDEIEILLDAYKEAYMELKENISQLRKDQKNPIIPDGMVRKIPSKIKYAEITKTVEDLGKVEIAILEVYKEIAYCKNEETTNINKEINEKYKDETMTKEEREEEKNNE